MMIRYFNFLGRAAAGAWYGSRPQCMNIEMSPPLFATVLVLVTNPFCWAYVNPCWGKSAVYQSL